MKTPAEIAAEMVNRFITAAPSISLETAYMMEAAIASAIQAERDGAAEPHTDRSQPCPKCGFRLVEVERQPFMFNDDVPEQADG